MAQRRDAKGRFASGGGGGGKLGKSAKNTKARAQYKKAAMEARVASRAQSNASKRGTANKFTASEAKRTKSNLTRVTNKLTARGAASKTAKTAKPAASRPAPKARTATASKKGKAAGGTKARKPDFKPKRKGATAASTVSEQAALARLGSGRRLRGKGNNPTARAERVLERGLSGTGRRARKSEATAKRAIDYMASQGTLGKRGKRRKA